MKLQEEQQKYAHNVNQKWVQEIDLKELEHITILKAV